MIEIRIQFPTIRIFTGFSGRNQVLNTQSQTCLNSSLQRRGEQGGKSPFSLLSEPIPPSSLLFLSTESIIYIGHRKEIRKLPNLFTVANLHYRLRSVDQTKLSCKTPTDAAPQFFKNLAPLFILV